MIKLISINNLIFLIYLLFIISLSVYFTIPLFRLRRLHLEERRRSREILLRFTPVRLCRAGVDDLEALQWGESDAGGGATDMLLDARGPAPRGLLLLQVPLQGLRDPHLRLVVHLASKWRDRLHILAECCPPLNLTNE